LVTHYASIVIERKEVIESISKYLVADGYFAKQEFVNILIQQTQIQVISKMRKDANLYYLPLEKHLRKSFSMSGVKTLHPNKIVADRIFSNLDLDLSCKKINQVYWDALWLGKISS